MDVLNDGSYMFFERKEIEEKLAPHLHKGEQLYYEIFGHTRDGKEIQSGFSYGCAGGQYKIILYRVTITTPDGFCVDLDREQVYRRAEELGLEKPLLLGFGGGQFDCDRKVTEKFLEVTCNLAKGKSALDANTMREGIVVWFKGFDGKWDCLKHKSEEFLIKESELRDRNVGDVEDNL